MTRLRTVGGINGAEYEKKYLLPFAPLEEALERHAKQGLATKAPDGRWYLTPEGFLVSNTIITDLLMIQEKCEPLAKKR
jgi:oxygen-independent coproporphyrinogen-3 oxidase